MNFQSWIERKKQNASDTNVVVHHRVIVARIKKAFLQNKLGCLSMIVKEQFHDDDSQISEVLGNLRTSFRPYFLSFEWFPKDQNGPGALLMRNHSVGLLIKTDFDSQPLGLTMTDDKHEPFCSIEPEEALSILSAQAHRQTAIGGPNSARLKLTLVK